MSPTAGKVFRRFKWHLMCVLCESSYFLDQWGFPGLGVYYKSLNTCCAIGWDLYGRPSVRMNENLWESWI